MICTSIYDNTLRTGFLRDGSLGRDKQSYLELETAVFLERRSQPRRQSQIKI